MREWEEFAKSDLLDDHSIERNRDFLPREVDTPKCKCGKPGTVHDAEAKKWQCDSCKRREEKEKKQLRAGGKEDARTVGGVLF